MPPDASLQNVTTPISQKFVQSIAPSFPQPDALPTFAGKPIQRILLAETQNGSLHDLLPGLTVEPPTTKPGEDTLAEKLANKILCGDFEVICFLLNFST